MLLLQDLNFRVNVTTKFSDKISDDPHFMKILMFSDENFFHLKGGVNNHNMRHWFKKNSEWENESSLNCPKVMVWTAMGHPVVIGPFFFEENMNGDSYLELLQKNFMSGLNLLENSSDNVFMQYGGPLTGRRGFEAGQMNIAWRLDRKKRF